MAVTTTLTPGGSRAKSWTVTFALGGDLIATIPHGFGRVPDRVLVTNRNVEAGVGQVWLGTVDNTNINIEKNAVALSAGAEVQVTAFMPGKLL